MPITLEQVQAELARRQQPPSGVTLDDVNAELQRRTAQPPAPTSRDIIASQLEAGRETLNQENIGRVLGMSAPAGLGTAAMLATQGSRMLPRAAAVGLATGAGDVGQQAGEAIRGEREAIDPTQAIASTVLGAGGQAAGEAIGAAGAGLTRFLTRGGARGRQGMQEAIADAARVGETPTLAQATKSSWLDSLEQTLSRVPGAAGRIRDRVQSTTANVRNNIERLSTIGGRGLDAQTGGLATIRGIEDFVEGVKTRAGPIFNEITNRVGAATPASVANTSKTLQEITQPIAGAQRVSERLSSPFLKGLADDLAADAGATGAIPFEGLQRVRTLVGDRLSNPALLNDTTKAQLNRVYGAITDDLEVAAKAAGAPAEEAFKRANRFWRSARTRIDDTLEPLIRNRVPEKVFDSLVSGARSGPTQLRAVMKSLSPQQQDAVTGSVIRRLGTATPGQQGAEGAEFSFNTFLTRWNQLDDKARDVLFSRGRNLGMKQDINALARYADRVRESSKAFANPSGTSGATIAGTAALMGAGSLMAAPFLGQDKLTAPLILGLAMGGSNVAARMMMSPAVVRWLAQATRVNPQGIPAHIARLGAISKREDPETQQAILSYMEQLQ